MSKESTQDHDQDKELLERYRRASGADSAAPSEAVRAAILAEGRRAAEARAKELSGQPFDTSRPPANDSRWKITAFGTAGAALFAALLFAPNLWKTVPSSPSAPPPPADAAQSPSAGALQSPKPASLQSSSDAREPVAPPRKQEAVEPPKATGLQRRTDSQRVPPQQKSETPPQSDALAETTAPQNYTAASAAAPISPMTSSLIAGRVARTRSELQPAALQSAAASGDTARTIALLDQGAPLDARDDQGRTPLMRAVTQNRLEVVRLLLDRGADPNLADNTGSTPLQQAKRQSLGDIAAVLQRAGAH
jgi:hypothetical protein